ncbi:unnamed protein product, partial [Cylicocyclus nassatus]
QHLCGYRPLLLRTTNIFITVDQRLVPSASVPLCTLCIRRGLDSISTEMTFGGVVSQVRTAIIFQTSEEDDLVETLGQ